MVVADDTVHGQWQVAYTPGLVARVLDGNVHRHRQRVAVSASGHAHGPDRPESDRLSDRTDNAGRLDFDISGTASKSSAND